MAIIGKIRKQSTVLLIAIGGAMVLFVLGDLLGSGTSMFAGPDDKVGEINGTKITYREFENQVQKAVEMRLGGGASAEQLQQIRNQVWDEVIREHTMEKQMKELGLSVSDRELFYVIQNDPQNPIIRSYFSDPQTGQLYEQFRSPDGTINTDAVIEYFQNVLSADPSENPEVMDAQRSFGFLVDNMRMTMQENKFNHLVASGMYATNIEVERENESTGKYMTISYALKKYSDMPDADFEPTEKELKNYYNKHKHEKRFKQKEPVRSIDYVRFDVVPTPEDTQEVLNQLEQIKNAFSFAEDDSTFVNENADTPFNLKWTQGEEFPGEMDSLVMNAVEDTIFGPYLNENRFELLKVKRYKMAPDSAKARHILMAPNEEMPDTADIRIVLDSLKTEIENGADFGALARQYSTDPGSKDQGGELDWFAEGQMVPEFSDFVFENKPGDLGIAASQFGLHLIEIQEHSEDVKKAFVAVIDNEIEPSQNTFRDVYSKANSFAVNNKSSEDFLENGERFGLQSVPALRPGDQTVEGIPNSREVVRWAFNSDSDVGDVSSVFDLQGIYLVALITEVREKGTLPFELARDDIYDEVMNKKKAEKAEEMLGGTGGIDEAAEKWSTVVEQSQPFSFSEFSISGMGREPEVQGAAFSMNEGDVSEPIEGRRGAYVIRLDKVDVREGTANKQAIETRYGSNAGNKVREALKENADIEDNRPNFY